MAMLSRGVRMEALAIYRVLSIGLAGLKASCLAMFEWKRRFCTFTFIGREI
jgi:hypothetical protein